ncbi:glucose-6-phosphate isomerase [Idiomarina sp.]|uniref:glucose-6-phosphate isomerase n=1 Tax=Idiomarina sp. TaxID=1874361 RepID=UPI003519B2E7
MLTIKNSEKTRNLISLDDNYLFDDAGDWRQEVLATRDLSGLIQQLVSGRFKNTTEGRLVTHTLCRNKEAIAQLKQPTNPFNTIVNQIRSGEWLGATGKPITDVVNIGVGGSDLGPQMASFALKEFDEAKSGSAVDVHFVSSMDGGQLYAVLPIIDPESTLFIVASKSFGTIDTFANVDTVKHWVSEVMSEQDWFAKHVIGVSSNAEKMSAYGIPAAHQLSFDEGVGGRFSLWSTIGLSIAVAIGMKPFCQVLEGALDVDEHFLNAPIDENLPVRLALNGVYLRESKGINNLAVLPYDGRLRMLPSYLQQLDMESNGKQATRDNEALNKPTGPILWGGFGPNGQHAFYQHLHQGFDDFAADFILVLNRSSTQFSRKVADSLKLQQRLSVANCLAHRRLLWLGDKSDDSPRDNYPGGHASNLVMLDELTPESFGALIAVYEHKIFIQGVLWNINSFDQPGVEKGKKYALSILDALASEQSERFDDVTESLIHYYKQHVNIT